MVEAIVLESKPYLIHFTGVIQHTPLVFHSAAKMAAGFSGRIRPNVELF